MGTHYARVGLAMVEISTSCGVVRASVRRQTRTRPAHLRAFIAGIQQSPLRYAATAGLFEFIRLSIHCTHARAQALPGYPCSPSDFRQALPANGAGGEAPLKVMGVRGARGGPEQSRALILKITGALKNRDRGDLEW